MSRRGELFRLLFPLTCFLLALFRPVTSSDRLDRYSICGSLLGNGTLAAGDMLVRFFWQSEVKRCRSLHDSQWSLSSVCRTEWFWIECKDLMAFSAQVPKLYWSRFADYREHKVKAGEHNLAQLMYECIDRWMAIVRIPLISRKWHLSSPFSLCLASRSAPAG